MKMEKQRMPYLALILSFDFFFMTFFDINVHLDFLLFNVIEKFLHFLQTYIIGQHKIK